MYKRVLLTVVNANDEIDYVYEDELDESASENVAVIDREVVHLPG